MLEEVREYDGLNTSREAGFPPPLLPASPETFKKISLFQLILSRSNKFPRLIIFSKSIDIKYCNTEFH